MSKNKNKLSIFVVVILMFIAIPVSAESGIKIKKEHQECSSANECTLFNTDCLHCGCGIPINKYWVPYYENEFKIKCHNYTGTFCDAMCPKEIMQCIKGQCVNVGK